MRTIYQATVSYQTALFHTKHDYLVDGAEELKALSELGKASGFTVIGHRIQHVMTVQEILKEISKETNECHRVAAGVS